MCIRDSDYPTHEAWYVREQKGKFYGKTTMPYHGDDGSNPVSYTHLRLYIIILLMVAFVLPSNAVLKEANLDTTLDMLRTELTNYHIDLEKQNQAAKAQQLAVIQELISICLLYTSLHRTFCYLCDGQRICRFQQTRQVDN